MLINPSIDTNIAEHQVYQRSELQVYQRSPEKMPPVCWRGPGAGGGAEARVSPDSGSGAD